MNKHLIFRPTFYDESLDNIHESNIQLNNPSSISSLQQDRPQTPKSGILKNSEHTTPNSELHVINNN